MITFERNDERYRVLQNRFLLGVVAGIILAIACASVVKFVEPWQPTDNLVLIFLYVVFVVTVADFLWIDRLSILSGEYHLTVEEALDGHSLGGLPIITSEHNGAKEVRVYTSVAAMSPEQLIRVRLYGDFINDGKFVWAEVEPVEDAPSA